MEKILVTGAGGFIGQALLEKLAKENKEVYALIRDKNRKYPRIENLPNVKLIYLQMEDISQLDKLYPDLKVDTIYHLAWQGVSGSGRADYEIQLNNVSQTCKLMELAPKLSCDKFLMAGTISECIAEDILEINTAAQNNIYAICKSTAHRILTVMARDRKIDLVWMRMANVYGPREKGENLIDYIINELENGKSPKLTLGLQPYDLIYVEDLAKALYLLGEKTLKRNLYYIGNGQVKLLKDLVEEVCQIHGSNIKASFGLKKEDGLIYKKEWFDTKDLQEDTDYKADFSLREGIEETIDKNRSLSKE